jgi:transcriptional regulator with PAS, ATPase and Fis domain
MYISSIIINTDSNRNDWITHAYKGRQNSQIEELLIIRHGNRAYIFTVGINPDILDAELNHLLERLPDQFEWSLAEKVAHDQSFSHFIHLYWNIAIDSPNLLTEVKEDFNRALNYNAVGPILTRFYRQGFDFAQRIANHQQIVKNPISASEVILDISRKISEDLNRFQLILFGENRDLLEQLVQTFRKYSNKKVLLCSSEFENSYAQSVELGSLPINLSQIEQFLGTDTIFVNTSNNTAKIWEEILPAIKQNRNALYLYFQSGSNSVQSGVRKIPNIFLQTKQNIQSVIELNVQKRRQYFNEISDEVQSEVREFYNWLFSDNRFLFGDMVSQNRQMHNIFELIRRIAPTDVNVLIQGATGTGKELVARAIHKNSSRINNNFIAVNCSAIPETLLEGELFGYERGAFTGALNMKKGLIELASGGTLFLDEISDVPPLIQVKLLRVLQEREIMRLGNPTPIKVDVRLVVATHRELRHGMKEGSFRSDLYYRINTVQINLPTLAERKEDIILLSRHFMQKSNIRFNKTVRTMAEDVRNILLSYPWPGNIRELENVIERAVAVSIGDTLTMTDLPVHMLNTDSKIEIEKQYERNNERSLKEMEAAHIRELLEKEQMNYNRVAEVLGISRTTLWRKMKEYEISK